MAPQVRASLLKDNLDAIRRLGQADASRILGRAPQSVAVIEGALRASWLDVDHDLAITEATQAELGTHGVRQLNVETLARSVEGPMLKALWDAGVRLFGLSPAGLLRWADQFWGQVYRGCGTLTFDAAQSCLNLDGAPAVLIRSNPWLEGLAGACDGVLQLCRVQGTTEVKRLDDTRAVLVVRIAARAAPAS